MEIGEEIGLLLLPFACPAHIPWAGNKTFRKVKLNKFYNIIYAIKTCTPLAPTTTALVCLKCIYIHIYPACILGPAVAPICPRPPTAFFGTVESAEL